MAFLERYVSTSGSATNGGSSEGSPKATGASWAASTTTVTATNIGSSGVIAGDLVYLAGSSGGYNTNWFKIASVTDSDNVVVHTSPGASGTNWAVGGAVTLEICRLVAKDGDRWNIKADGTYALTATTDFANDGLMNYPICYRGYSSTIGDSGRAVITVSSTYTIAFSGDYLFVSNLDIRLTTGMCSLNHTNGRNVLYNCIVTGAGNDCIASYYSAVCNCKIVSTSSSTTSKCVSSWALNSFVLNCYIDGQNGIANDTINDGNGRVLSVIGCVINVKNASSGYGIRQSDLFSRQAQMVGNTIYNAAYGIYVDATGPINGTANISNNLFVNCGTGIYNTDSANMTGLIAIFGNAFASCTNKYINLGDTLSIGEVAFSGDPFIDAANGDFRLNSTAGAGALCRATGFPTDMNLDGTQDNWLDIGALQSEPTTSSSGGYIPIRTSGINFWRT